MNRQPFFEIDHLRPHLVLATSIPSLASAGEAAEKAVIRAKVEEIKKQLAEEAKRAEMEYERKAQEHLDLQEDLWRMQLDQQRGRRESH